MVLVGFLISSSLSFFISIALWQRDWSSRAAGNCLGCLTRKDLQSAAATDMASFKSV